MKSSELILFESAQSCLRLSINTMYESENNGNTRQLVYINNNNGRGSFRPSVFLAFTYVTEDFTTTKNVIAAIPHMYRLRKAFRDMHDLLSDPNAFTTVNGALMVNQGYEDNIVVDLSAKSGDWLSLTLTSATANNTDFKAVMLQGSKFYNGSASVLTEDEFNTIYDIIEHIDMVSLENQAVLIALATNGVKSNTNNQGGYQQNAPRPQVQRNNGYTANGNGYQQPQARPSYQTNNVNTGYANNTQPAYNRQQPQAQPAQQNVPNRMPPRPAVNNTPKVSMENIQDISVDMEEMDFNDTALVDNIFAQSQDYE